MSAVEIKKDIYWVGVKNPELRVFDIIMSTKKGTTYNSYLIVDEKVVLIDAVKDGFHEQSISNIKEIIGDRSIDYIIVQHTEPDHSGSLVKILEEYKDAVVIASKPALINIKNIINRDFKGIEAKEDLNIGKRTLQFVSAPLLHWPDTIFTYDEYDKILFTCDCFGCHYCHNEIFNNVVGDFSNEFKYYFDCIMSPFKKNALSAIEKIKPLMVDIIAPSHGPIHRDNPWKYVSLYEEWSKGILEKNEDKYAVVTYVSAYGYTKKIAEAIAEGIRNAGVKVECFDITELELNQIIEKIEKSKALVVGSPTINQDVVEPVWNLLSHVSPIVNRGKRAMAFGSYGWSGEAVPMITERLKSLKFKVIEPGLKVIFKPTDEDLENAKSKGYEIGSLI
jgi:flavorubredoxin